MSPDDHLARERRAVASRLKIDAHAPVFRETVESSDHPTGRCRIKVDAITSRCRRSGRRRPRASSRRWSPRLESITEIPRPALPRAGAGPHRWSKTSRNVPSASSMISSPLPKSSPMLDWISVATDHLTRERRAGRPVEEDRPFPRWPRSSSLATIPPFEVVVELDAVVRCCLSIRSPEAGSRPADRHPRRAHHRRSRCSPLPSAAVDSADGRGRHQRPRRVGDRQLRCQVFGLDQVAGDHLARERRAGHPVERNSRRPCCPRWSIRRPARQSRWNRKSSPIPALSAIRSPESLRVVPPMRHTGRADHVDPVQAAALAGGRPADRARRRPSTPLDVKISRPNPAFDCIRSPESTAVGESMRSMPSRGLPLIGRSLDADVRRFEDLDAVNADARRAGAADRARL